MEKIPVPAFARDELHPSAMAIRGKINGEDNTMTFKICVSSIEEVIADCTWGGSAFPPTRSLFQSPLPAIAHD